MNDKRRPKRYPRRLTVRFGEGDKLDRTGFTTDISVTGLFLVAPVVPPPIDARVHMQIMLEGGRFLFVEGIVRRHKTPPRELQAMEHKGFGVRFLTVEELLGEMVPKAAPAEREPVPETSVVGVPQIPALPETPAGAVRPSPAKPNASLFEVTFATPAELKAAWDRELKLGGIFVKSDWVVTPQSEVVLVFVLPFAGKRIDVPSRVLAITPTGVAFGFEKAKLQTQIAAYLA